MIDWHSHLLPGIDDGSQSVSESLSILSELVSQGVDVVAATPHFIANDESVSSFIERRQLSYNRMVEQNSSGPPKMLLGAEVKYYPGISRLEELEKLKIQGTNLLLLEMPISRWTEYTVRELSELASSKKVNVMLAHIERYMPMQSKEVWYRLLDEGILMQVNASYLLGLSKRKAIKQLTDGMIHFIGSDCHNMTSRPPKIKSAVDYIAKKIGADFVSQMNEFGYSQLDK